MKRRKWTPEQKAFIVIAGLKQNNLSQVCNENGISQAQYYKWKDQFLANAQKAFEVEKISQRQQKLQNENQKLKNLVGELSLELKKSEEWL